mmetsp:Transcript_6489/g.9607  ORF Transcript_6489/g.9607 Transcript_6489/m.9607 type:complete len:298 (-) Transcript_6489:38-931(-)
MSNKFNWESYEVPHRWTEEEDKLRVPSESFTIRHLKQGATGARKTWPAAEVLLEYLVQRGGLRDVSDKIPSGDHETLDLTLPPARPSFQKVEEPYNIVELGGGTGMLSAGLSLALNDVESTTRLICTDNDKPTLKNMRHNISRQPASTNMNKTVRIEALDWGQDVGGDKFSSALRSQFRNRSTETTRETCDHEQPQDPLRLLSHLIASDVLYGTTTVDPLSSVISAVKLRNPHVIVVLLLKERSPNSVAILKQKIEAKVQQGLDMKDQPCESNLQGFQVSVRDVIHNDLEDMKMVEC